MLGAGIVIGRRGLAERRMPAVTIGVSMLAAGCAISAVRPSLAIVAVGTAVALAAVPILSAASTTIMHERVPAAMHGRMFALRGGVTRALDPIGSLVAGVAISVVAQPAMSPGGALEHSVGRVLATGEGRGAALVSIGVALVLGLVAMVARSSASLRHLDEPPSGQVDPLPAPAQIAAGRAVEAIS
jgi:hypothetical protein